MFYNFLLLTILVISTHGQINQKICTTRPSYDSACQQIARNLTVACNYNLHSVDCLLNIKNHRSQIGRITGDEALLGANRLPDTVVVLGEIGGRHPPSDTVVVVKTEIPDGFQSLKGKKFCHPGYKHDSLFSNHLLQEFENKIVESESPVCLDNVTLLERHISTLNQFFGQSCRPGPWTQSDRKNEEWQTKYDNLCRLCGPERCQIEYNAPFNDSLKCLFDNDADVAVTSLQEAEKLFNQSSNTNRYKYFCKDGSSRFSSTPCVWSSKLPDLLVAERNNAYALEQYLRDYLKKFINTTRQATASKDDTTTDALKIILNIANFERITFLEERNYKSLAEYVRGRTSIPSVEENKLCDRTMKWCTFSDKEQEKCLWLRQAAVNWGIQPVIECIRSEGDDELSCLDDLKRGTADLVVASSDYAYISFNKGLRSIAFPETDTRNLSVILAVKRSNDSSINSLSDLKQKRACIPQFGGKEHLALIDTTRSLRITTEQECDYGELLNGFVGNSCVPGVRSPLISEVTDNVDKDKLCEQCEATEPIPPTATYCNADPQNRFYGSEGAIECIRSNKGDFAIITKTNIENDTDLIVICKNDSLATGNGLDVDSNCVLSVIASSEVVVKENNTKRTDIKLALYEFERWFGQNLKKPFNLFDRFDNELDLLFKDSTPGLNFENDLDYIKEYKELLARVKKCNRSGAYAVKASLVFLVITFVLFI